MRSQIHDFDRNGRSGCSRPVRNRLYQIVAHHKSAEASIMCMLLNLPEGAEDN
jgi:hypothetical protein